MPTVFIHTVHSKPFARGIWPRMAPFWRLHRVCEPPMRKWVLLWRRQRRRTVQHGSEAGLGGWLPSAVVLESSRSGIILPPPVELRRSAVARLRLRPRLEVRTSAVGGRLRWSVGRAHDVPDLLKVVLRVARHLTRLHLWGIHGSGR